MSVLRRLPRRGSPSWQLSLNKRRQPKPKQRQTEQLLIRQLRTKLKLTKQLLRRLKLRERLPRQQLWTGQKQSLLSRHAHPHKLRSCVCDDVMLSGTTLHVQRIVCNATFLLPELPKQR